MSDTIDGAPNAHDAAVRAMPRLPTERLCLRPFTAGDGPEVERLAGAREVADTTLNIPHPYPAGGGAHWIATHAPAWERGESLTLAICTRDEPSRLLGAISLALSAAHRHAEVGYWIEAASWGNGYATEAAHALFHFAFTQLGLHRIVGRHMVRNPASGRVMQKLGMRLEGVNRDAYQRWGRFEDIAMYGLLETEWPRPTAAPQ